MSSPSAMPQQAQHIMSAADDSKLFVQLIVYQSPPMLRAAYERVEETNGQNGTMTDGDEARQ